MVQSNPVQRDTEGAIEGVRIKGVSAPGGEYSTFQVTGMIKEFDFRIFLGRQILASIFWGSLIQAGIFFGYSKLMFLFFLLHHLMLSGNFYGSEIRHGIFLVLLQALGIFWGF